MGRAALVVKKVGGMRPEALGPWIYTLLDGQAAWALGSIDTKDMCTEGGEELVFRELDQRFPDEVGTGPYERSHGGSVWAENHEKTRRQRLSLDDRDLCLPVFSRKV